MSIMNMPPLPYVKRIPGLDYDALKAAYTDPTRVGQFRSRDASRCAAPTRRRSARRTRRSTCCRSRCRPTSRSRASTTTSHTAILRQLEKDIEAVRFDTPEGKIELPVKLQGLRLDLRAARQMGDAAGRQLSLRHQGRHAHRAGGGAQRHRDVALGLQFRVRPVRQARRQAGRSRAVREIRRGGAEPDAAGLGRARAATTARPTSSAPTSWCS